MKNKDYGKYGKLVTVRIDPDLYHRFKVLVMDQQRSVAHVTESLMLSYVNKYESKKGRK